MEQKLELNPIQDEPSKPKRNINTMGILALISSLVAAALMSSRSEYCILFFIGSLVLIAIAFAEAIVHYRRFVSLIIALVFCGYGVYGYVEPDLESNSGKEAAAPALSVSVATPEPDYDFRSTCWSMSVAEVKASETGTPSEETDEWIIYDDKNVVGLSTGLGYNFSNGELVSGVYLIQEEHTNSNLYIDDYNQCKKALIILYGEPEIDEMLWSNDYLEDNEQNYGMAVAYGYLSYICGWTTDTTMITMTLHGDNFEFSHVISYQDKDYEAETNTDGL